MTAPESFVADVEEAVRIIDVLKSPAVPEAQSQTHLFKTGQDLEQWLDRSDRDQYSCRYINMPTNIVGPLADNQVNARHDRLKTWH